MSDSRTYSISDLAQEHDVTTRTIRFYEEKGLLHPARSGQHRIYNNSDRVRLQLILRGKRAGLSLEESREIIDMYEPGGDNVDQYRFLLEKVDQKQFRLEKQIEDIRHLIDGLEEVRERVESALQHSSARDAHS